MKILNYTPALKEKCIEIFKSNMPKFFAAEELQPFIDFLDHDIEDNYYVVEKDGDIVACGGIFLEDDGKEAGLSWGMVRADHHRTGIGKMLTEYRLGLLQEVYPGKIYKVDTSQHTAGFYLKRGFETIEVIPDGFAKGIDKYVMKMMKNKKSIIHHVFFWLKNPGSEVDRKELISGIKKLRSIETVNSLQVGIAAKTEQRDVIDSSWDVSELMYFDDLNAQLIYQSHQLHLEFIEKCSHLWTKVLVYDMEEV